MYWLPCTFWKNAKNGLKFCNYKMCNNVVIMQNIHYFMRSFLWVSHVFIIHEQSVTWYYFLLWACQVGLILSVRITRGVRCRYMNDAINIPHLSTVVTVLTVLTSVFVFNSFVTVLVLVFPLLNPSRVLY